MIYYKVRSKKTGLFSKGAGGVWDKTGKVWVTLGKLRSFITVQMNRYSGRPDFNDWEIVEFEVLEKEVKAVHEVVDPKKIIELLKQK